MIIFKKILNKVFELALGKDFEAIIAQKSSRKSDEVITPSHHLNDMHKPQQYRSTSYDTGQSYRQYERISRIMTISFIVSLFTNIALALTIYALFPLKQIQPYVMALRDKQDQVIHIQPIIIESKSFDIMIEQWCRDYVIDRETINGVDDAQRQQDTVYLFSSQNIWDDFDKLMNPSQKNSPLKQHKEMNATRSVKIDLVTKLQNNLWRVEWTSITRRIGEEEATRKSWVSTMEIEFNDLKIPEQYKLRNPYGMTITKYSINDGRGN